MNKATFTFFALIFCSSSLLFAQHKGHEDKVKSGYAGQESRLIKSLSAADIQELKSGQGWGLAKAAELNGVPGPRHVLDMGDQISLSEEQKVRIEGIFNEMQVEAIDLGNQVVEKEQQLNEAFSSQKVNPESLKAMVSELGVLYGELRYVHLNAHLKTIDILSPHQVMQYNQLRGYASVKPCGKVPEGHDPEMWKQHNDCED